MSQEITPEIRNQVASDIVAKLSHRLSVLNTTIEQTQANYNALCGRRLELQETLMHMTRLAQEESMDDLKNQLVAPEGEEPPKVETDDKGEEVHDESLDSEHE